MIWEEQQARKRNEREPRDWATYRDALIESGMVEEAHYRRHIEDGQNFCSQPFIEAAALARKDRAHPR
jgi:hypothetical protein